MSTVMFITEAPNWLAVVTGEVQDELGLVTPDFFNQLTNKY